MRELACPRRAVLRVLTGCIAMIGMPGPVRAHRLARKKPRLPYQPMIVLDPGHGGVDPGAIGPGGVYERGIVYPTARYLAGDLVRTRRFRVALTRGPDEFVALRERVARARTLRADLFLSIHADALPDTAMRGLSVFTLSAIASDREAAALAASENGDVVNGVHFSQVPRMIGEILADLTRDQTDNLSVAFARDVVAALGHQVVLLDNPQRSADFAVLTAADIPSALVELGCLSNPREESLLQQPAYQQRLAHGLARAIEAYFAVHRPG